MGPRAHEQLPSEHQRRRRKHRRRDQGVPPDAIALGADGGKLDRLGHFHRSVVIHVAQTARCEPDSGLLAGLQDTRGPDDGRYEDPQSKG